MKIAIIDDDQWVVAVFWRSLKTTHEVLPVEIFDLTRGEDPDQKCGIVARAVREFSPDFILLDHDLSIMDGEELAMALGYSRDKLIGISGSYPQEYCGKHFCKPRYCEELSHDDVASLLETIK